MLTTSHAYLAWRAARRRPGGAWVALGAAAPDLPAMALLPVGRARGLRGGELLAWTYRGRLERLHLMVHGLPVAALVLALPSRRARALGAGWLSHQVIDYASHHDDAWPPLHPLSRRAWRSPVSYWQPEHGARAWSVAECALLGAAAATDRSRAGRLAALGALAVAALPLMRPTLWRGHRDGTPGAHSAAACSSTR